MPGRIADGTLIDDVGAGGHGVRCVLPSISARCLVRNLGHRAALALEAREVVLLVREAFLGEEFVVFVVRAFVLVFADVREVERGCVRAAEIVDEVGGGKEERAAGREH